jgi:uncharacterized cupin superfamily protein
VFLDLPSSTANVIRKFSAGGLPHQELQSGRTGEKYSLSAVLTDALSFRDVFVHHDVIPPGRRASGVHFHSHREEMVFVLEGRVRAWCNGAEVVLGPGDFVGFLPGEENAHTLINDTDTPASVLIVASNPAGDEVGYL